MTPGYIYYNTYYYFSYLMKNGETRRDKNEYRLL